MSLADAALIVSRLGPCTLALDEGSAWPLASALRRLGCVVRAPGDAYATVAVVGGDATAVAGHVATLVVVAGSGTDRAAVESPVLAAGWSRHPAGLAYGDAGAWGEDRLPAITFYRRGGGGGLLSRGVDADAAIVRLTAAATLVRNGDAALLIDADGTDAVAIVAALSPARSVTAGSLVDQAPASLDTVIVTGSADRATIDAAAVALKPDGRLILALGADADRIEAAVADRFVVDRRVGLPDGSALLVAAADPLGAAQLPYHHPIFAAGDGVLPAIVDFAAAYDNPHLYRLLVQIGERIGDDMVLARLAECVIEDSEPASADRGAAVAVLGYRILDLGLIDSIDAAMGLIDDYLAATATARAPHVIRWRLSLFFLAGRLCEVASQPAQAIGWFDAAAGADWAAFSPILATKAIAGAFHAARLHLALGQRDAAIERFRHGVATALAAAGASHRDMIGDPAKPLPFYFQELAEVMDMAGQCAVVLNSLHLLDRDPGLFWRGIDVKRFGLFAWADALRRDRERTNPSG